MQLLLNQIMKLSNGTKTKNVSLFPSKKSTQTQIKDRATNTTTSTQCEERPNHPKEINQFNFSKQKATLGPFILKKTTRNQMNNASNSTISSNKNNPSINSTNDNAYSMQGGIHNNNSTNFIPYLKFTASSIDNVSKLIANASSNSISTAPVTDKKMEHSDSSSDIKQKLFNQLVQNERQNSKKNLFEQSVNLSSSVSISNISSSYITKSASSRIIPKRMLFIEQEAISNKPVIITSEDLFLLENKLQDILNTIQEGFTVSKECFEWWNFYFSSSIAGNYEEYFLNFSNQKKIGSYVNIELLCIMVCYSLSFDYDAYQNQLKNVKTILSLLHFNLLLIIKFIMTIQKVHDYSYLKLELMLKKSLTAIQEKDIDEFFITSLIHHNMLTVSSLFQEIIANEFKGFNHRRLNTFFNYSYQNRDSIPVEEYNEFFRFNLIQVDNIEGDVLASSIKGAYPIPIKIKVPYLPIMIHFKYTLVIDLDETLIYMKEDLINPENSKVLYRPGLFEFLQKMKHRFELVLFTVGTKQYADNIINSIEANEKYFDYRLYRHHATVIGHDFIKDLNKLGRDMSGVIIIDNMPQNFRLQKENGIFIKPYYGDNKNDTALMHLGELLFKIASDNSDVRKSISKYKNDIISKISLNKIS